MALAESPLPVLKLQVLFHFLDYAKGKLEHLTVSMLNGVRAFSKVNPVLASIATYALCTAAGFILWIAMCFLDLAAGTCVLEAAIHVIEALNEHVLPALQLLNGALALFMGFVILVGRIRTNVNVNSNRPRHNPNKMSTLSNRSKMIAALPKAKYRCLRRSDDANSNDSSSSSSSSCAICLGCIGEEDEVRILPNCRHNFHISCIGRWLLPCTVNNSSCPMCRATVLRLHTLQGK